MIASGYQERLVYTRMIQVVGNSCDERGHYFHTAQMLTYLQTIIVFIYFRFFFPEN